jgi:putative addiction module component (TIGR02574 family)
MTLKEITAEALKLSEEGRAELAHQLILSLDIEEETPDPEHERLWREEIERRCRSIEEGTAKLIPAEEVFARVHKALE